MALTVDGHTLAHTGSAVDDETLPTGRKDGRGACACGERSEVLPTNGARRAWHRAHVREIAVGAEEPW